MRVFICPVSRKNVACATQIIPERLTEIIPEAEKVEAREADVWWLMNRPGGSSCIGIDTTDLKHGGLSGG